MRIELPKKIIRTIDLLNKSGFDAYVVGGCVRDTILGNKPFDWDISTSALPCEISSVFNEYKTIETGLKHGTITVIMGDLPVEITSFRIDGEYSDFRHPDFVSFTKDLHSDLSRRDFTINSLAYNHTSGLVDLFDGVKDIHDGIIRCVGNPKQRFAEDALRIMRALRFSSVLGFTIEEETDNAIHSLAYLLHNIAAERISCELSKLLIGKNVYNVLINHHDIFSAIIPELQSQAGFEQVGKKHAYDIWGHTCQAVANIEPELLLRLSMLLHDTGKPETHIFDENGNSLFRNHAAVGEKIAYTTLTRLRFDNKTIKKVAFLVGMHDFELPKNKIQLKKLLRHTGIDIFKLLLKIKKADRGALSKDFADISYELQEVNKMLKTIIENKEAFSLDTLAIDGKMLISEGITGKATGKMLSYLLDAVIEDKCDNDVKSLLEYAKYAMI